MRISNFLGHLQSYKILFCNAAEEEICDFWGGWYSNFLPYKGKTKVFAPISQMNW